jgi:hypothetical protein
MNRPFLLLTLTLIPLLPARAEQPTGEQKLVGEWRYEDDQQHLLVRYVFRSNGTFSSELWRKGELGRKLEGLWAIEGNMLVYIYTSDSRGQGQPGLQERDRLLRIDESSYTIEAGDKAQRTYFRVKTLDAPPRGTASIAGLRRVASL